jgi:hypothetical protein
VEAVFFGTLKNPEKNCGKLVDNYVENLWITFKKKKTESFPQVFHRVFHRFSTGFSTDFPKKIFRKF